MTGLSNKLQYIVIKYTVNYQYFTGLQDFANQAEAIFRGSERHTDLDKAYKNLVRAIFDNICRIAAEHPKTPREVIMMGRFFCKAFFTKWFPGSFVL